VIIKGSPLPERVIVTRPEDASLIVEVLERFIKENINATKC
jgi:hypothetical protein